MNCTPPAHSQFTFVPEDGEDLFNMLEVSAASSSPPEHSCFANHGARRHIYPIDVTGKRHIWGIPKIAKTILEKEFVPTQDHGEFLMTIVRDPTQRLFSYLHFRARKLYNAAHSNDGDQVSFHCFRSVPLQASYCGCHTHPNLPSECPSLSEA